MSAEIRKQQKQYCIQIHQRYYYPLPVSTRIARGKCLLNKSDMVINYCTSISAYPVSCVPSVLLKAVSLT